MPLIEVKPGVPLVPAGTYPASLISIKPKKLTTKFSKPGTEDDFLEWTWLVDAGDQEIEITSLTSLSTGPKSTMFKTLTALLSPKPVNVGDGFDEEDLVGKQVLINMVVTEDGFSKVGEIIPAPVARKAKTEAPARVVAPAVEGAEDDLPF